MAWWKIILEYLHNIISKNIYDVRQCYYREWEQKRMGIGAQELERELTINYEWELNKN